MSAETSDTTCKLSSLCHEIHSVRESILRIVLRMDNIELQRLPQIRATYALRIGYWKQAFLEAKLAGQRARQRLALAQVQANQGKAPLLEAIDAQLDRELAEESLRVQRARDAHERALMFVTDRVPLGRAEARELKRLYRTLVKRLHPDVRPSNSDERVALNLLSQATYKCTDVETLRSLEVATRYLSAGKDDLLAVSDPEVLAQELELAYIEEGVMRERLGELESCEEMQLGKLLTDPEWVATRMSELHHATEGWKQVRQSCEEQLQTILAVFDA